MQQPEQPVLRDIVLVGGGHSHVVVLKNFAMNPIPGVRLTLICRDTHTPYSGMLPGYVAGHYSYDDVHIDLSRLAEYAGARFYRSEAINLDKALKKVICKDRPPISYDLLSINIGSTPQVYQVKGAKHYAIPVKPIRGFNERWKRLLEQVRTHVGKMDIVTVGGGAGGVELTLAMQFRLRKELTSQGKDPSSLHFTLITSSEQILPTHHLKVRKKFESVLKKRGVTVLDHSAVIRVDEGQVFITEDKFLPADEILWVTQAGGAAWLQKTGLELDKSGFILVEDSLQTLEDPSIFAAGDIATMIHHPREKAGVFAVRQGKPLADNLRLAVTGKPVKAYHPQKHWLSLISTGNKYAVASRGERSYWGVSVWYLKDWIDRRFMKKFSQFESMREEEPKPISLALNQEERTQAISAVAMRCGGCGAKVGSSVLSRALSSLQPVENDNILIGLHAPDDAAVVRIPEGMAVVHTVDFFRAFIDDPYVLGQVAANHSLGDIFAMGATPQSATAIATVPSGLESKVEEVVFQMMSGAVDVLNEADCALVGGHTGEGKELALGFAVNGYVDPDKVMSKDKLRAGDVIILTKPLGTGTLFAAHARLAAKGRWIDNALRFMCVSNQKGAQCLLSYGARACTDVTGFGLLGHLVEMTRPSHVDVRLKLSCLPVLDGAEETLASGILSSLQPANVRLRRAIRNQEKWVNHSRYALLFDPQTAGGLLAGVPENQAAACITELHKLGYSDAVIIGRVEVEGDAIEPVWLEE